MRDAKDIKFRIWDQEKYLNNGEEFSILDVLDGSTVLMESGFSDDLVFEQWTGTKDREGREIYEGDIVVKDGRDRVTCNFVRLWEVEYKLEFIFY